MILTGRKIDLIGSAPVPTWRISGGQGSQGQVFGGCIQSGPDAATRYSGASGPGCSRVEQAKGPVDDLGESQSARAPAPENWVCSSAVLTAPTALNLLRWFIFCPQRIWLRSLTSWRKILSHNHHRGPPGRFPILGRVDARVANHRDSSVCSGAHTVTCLNYGRSEGRRGGKARNDRCFLTRYHCEPDNPLFPCISLGPQVLKNRFTRAKYLFPQGANGSAGKDSSRSRSTTSSTVPRAQAQDGRPLGRPPGTWAADQADGLVEPGLRLVASALVKEAGDKPGRSGCPARWSRGARGR